MILQTLDAPAIFDTTIEFGYGIVYLLLMGYVFRKYRATGQKLALYFGLAFLCLGISGIYGSISGLLSELGYTAIPIIGQKILEIYTGLALVSLLFFFAGLMRLR